MGESLDREYMYAPLDLKGAVFDEVRNGTFRRLRSKLDNRTCIDCSSRNPTWLSLTFGVYLCLSCSGKHRRFGTHVSFVRSTDMDKFTPEQLLRMDIGGNGKIRVFLREHGLSEAKNLDYQNNRSLLKYRQHLDKEVGAELSKYQADSSSNVAQVSANLNNSQSNISQADDSQANTSQANNSQSNNSQAKNSLANNFQVNNFQANNSQSNNSQAKNSQANTSQANNSQSNNSQANNSQANNSQAKPSLAVGHQAAPHRAGQVAPKNAGILENNSNNNSRSRKLEADVDFDDLFNAALHEPAPINTTPKSPTRNSPRQQLRSLGSPLSSYNQTYFMAPKDAPPTTHAYVGDPNLSKFHGSKSISSADFAPPADHKEFAAGEVSERFRGCTSISSGALFGDQAQGSRGNSSLNDATAVKLENLKESARGGLTALASASSDALARFGTWMGSS